MKKRLINILSLSLILTCSYPFSSIAMEISTKQSVTWSDFDSEQKALVIDIHRHTTQCLTTAHDLYDSLSSTVDMIKNLPQSNLTIASLLSPLSQKKIPILENWNNQVEQLLNNTTKIGSNDENNLLMKQKINDGLNKIWIGLQEIAAEFKKQCAQENMNALEVDTLWSLIDKLKKQTIPQHFGGGTFPTITQWLWPEVEIINPTRASTSLPQTIMLTEISSLSSNSLSESLVLPPIPASKNEQFLSWEDTPEESWGLTTEHPSLSSSPQPDNSTSITYKLTSPYISEIIPEEPLVSTTESLAQPYNSVLNNPPIVPKPLISPSFSCENKPIVAQFISKPKEENKTLNTALSQETSPPKDKLMLKLEEEYKKYGWTSPYPSGIMMSVKRPLFSFSIFNNTDGQRTFKVLCDVAKIEETTPLDLIITSMTLPPQHMAVYSYERKNGLSGKFVKLSLKEISLIEGNNKEKSIYSRTSHDITEYNSFVNFSLVPGNGASQFGTSIARGIDSTK